MQITQEDASYTYNKVDAPKRTSRHSVRDGLWYDLYAYPITVYVCNLKPSPNPNPNLTLTLTLGTTYPSATAGTCQNTASETGFGTTSTSNPIP